MNHRRRPATRRLLIACAVIGLLLLTAAGALAAGAVTQRETIVELTEVRPGEDPCSGATGTGTLTETANGFMHLTLTATGTMHLVGMIEYAFTYVPDDPSQPAYSGREVSHLSLNVRPSNSIFSFTLAARGAGTDGSTLRFSEVVLGEFDPDGNLTIRFYQLNCA